MIAQVWQAGICWKIDTFVSRIRIITQSQIPSHSSWRSSSIPPSKSLDYVCKTKWWYNKISESIWHHHIRDGNTLRVIQRKQIVRWGRREIERQINHQPMNKSTPISSWIVAFLTLKWIWYFCFPFPFLQCHVPSHLLSSTRSGMTFMISSVHEIDSTNIQHWSRSLCLHQGSDGYDRVKFFRFDILDESDIAKEGWGLVLVTQENGGVTNFTLETFTKTYRHLTPARSPLLLSALFTSEFKQILSIFRQWNVIY